MSVKRLPISDLKSLARQNGLTHAILFGFKAEEGMQHVVTWGSSQDQCDQAAQWGDILKQKMDWPRNLMETLPSRVKTLRDRAVAAEARATAAETRAEAAEARLAAFEHSAALKSAVTLRTRDGAEREVRGTDQIPLVGAWPSDMQWFSGMSSPYGIYGEDKPVKDLSGDIVARVFNPRGGDHAEVRTNAKADMITRAPLFLSLLGRIAHDYSDLALVSPPAGPGQGPHVSTIGRLVQIAAQGLSILYTRNSPNHAA